MSNVLPTDRAIRMRTRVLGGVTKFYEVVVLAQNSNSVSIKAIETGALHTLDKAVTQWEEIDTRTQIEKDADAALQGHLGLLPENDTELMVARKMYQFGYEAIRNVDATAVDNSYHKGHTDGIEAGVISANKRNAELIKAAFQSGVKSANLAALEDASIAYKAGVIEGHNSAIRNASAKACSSKCQ